MVVFCDECSVLVDATYVDSYQVPHEVGATKRFTFLRCPRCETPFLIQQFEDFVDWTEPERLYPAEQSRLGSALPKPIQSALEEAARCLRVRSYTATAIMCRKTLEGICVHHAVGEGNLASRLKQLKERGIIDARLHEWADELRLSGNEAAHDVGADVSPADAAEMLDFTNALVEYTFTFRERFEVFKKRRASRGSAA